MSLFDDFSAMLSSMPSVIKGFARVVDLNRGLDIYDFSPSTDKKAMRRDWQIVGNDLKKAIHTYESTRHKRG